MSTKGLAVVLLLGAAGSRADEKPTPCSEVQDRDTCTDAELLRCAPYTPPMYVRVVAGVGAVPNVPGAFGELTVDAAYSSFSGNQVRGGAFSSGLSFSLGGAFDHRWVMLVAGLFMEVDLTYIAFSHFWSREPRNLPARMSVGTRLGAAVTQSYPSRNDAPYADPYLLVRPELHSFVDIAIPVGKWRMWAINLRGALDTPVALNSIFRWSVSVGFTWGWSRD